MAVRQEGSNMSGYVLSLDFGTQSIRVMVFDSKGSIRLQWKKAIPGHISREPGFAEQDPDVYVTLLAEGTQALKSQDSVVFGQIDTIVVTSQRDCTILVDKSGVLLRPAILWSDSRKAKYPRPLSWINKMAISAIGMKRIGEILSQNTHAHWVQDYEPKIWQQTYKCLQVSGFIHLRLTGQFLDGVANQIGHMPFEYKKFRWAKPGSMKAEMAVIEPAKRIDLVETGTSIGFITEEASLLTGIKVGTRVVAGASDKGCETLGVGCIDNNTAAISLGSQASIQTTTKRYYEVQGFIPPFPAAMPGYYNPELQIYRGYWMITWFKREFAMKEVAQAKTLGIAPEELLNRELEKVPPGAQGLMLMPFWGAAVKNPEAKGAIIGFSDAHTRIHIYRAIIEGIGFALYDGMLRIEKKSGKRVERIALSGGGSGSDAICLITANIFGRTVYRVQTNETSSLGAAIIGYVANGTYKDYHEAIREMVHVRDSFEPDPQVQGTYSKLYQRVYKNMYRRLKPLYDEMDKIDC